MYIYTYEVYVYIDTHIHRPHTHTYIYIYVYICIHIFRPALYMRWSQQLVILDVGMGRHDRQMALWPDVRFIGSFPLHGLHKAVKCYSNIPLSLRIFQNLQTE